MAGFLKLVSVIYLVFVWIVVFQVFGNPAFIGTGSDPSLAKFVVILMGITLTIPAAALFAFGSLVRDARKISDRVAMFERA